MTCKHVLAQLLGLALSIAGAYAVYLELHLASVSTMRVELFVAVMAIGLLIVIPAQMGDALKEAGRALAQLLPAAFTKPGPPLDPPMNPPTP